MSIQVGAFLSATPQKSGKVVTISRIEPRSQEECQEERGLVHTFYLYVLTI